MFSVDRDLYSDLQRLFLAMLALAAGMVLLFSIENHRLLAGAFSSLTLLFWFWLVVFYLGLVIVIALAGVVYHKQWGQGGRFLRRVTLLIGLFLLGMGVLYGPSKALFPDPYNGFGFISFILLLAAIVASVFYGESNRREVLGLHLIALGFFLGLVLFTNVSGQISPRLKPTGSKAVQLTREPLLVIGVDGADWDYIDPLIEQGKLPTFERLKTRGSWGRLKTIQPTESPVLWTTIATGQPPETHGINGFVGYRLFGSDELFGRPDFITGSGIGLIFPYIVQGSAPLNNSHRRSFAYWELASGLNQPLSVLNWWMTWPVDRISGAMITERIHYRRFGYLARPSESKVTYPSGLRGWALERLVPPSAFGYDDWTQYMNITRDEYEQLNAQPFRSHRLAGEFPFLLSMLESNVNLAQGLIERSKQRYDRPVDLMMLFRAVDLAGHMGLRYSKLVENRPSQSEGLKNAFGKFYGKIYQRIDRAIGTILSEYPDHNVVIVSDHGFERSTETGAVQFAHKDAPDGIWLAAGPAFRNRYRGSLSIYEVFPLLLKAKGLPVAQNLRGKVPELIFRNGDSQVDLPTVPAYGDRLPAKLLGGRDGTNRRIKSHLDGLGYF